MASIKSGAPWLRRQQRDIFVRRARQEAWRSRAVYKLEQIDREHKLINRRDCVVDLGGAPGSWAQYLVKRAAKVIVCDIQNMSPVDGAHFVRGDLTDPAIQKRIVDLAGRGGIDLLLSDAAPSLTGVAETDQAAIVALMQGTIDFAKRHLNHGGRILIKAFDGSQTQDLWRYYRRSATSSVKSIKPAASRSESRECYWLIRLSAKINSSTGTKSDKIQ